MDIFGVLLGDELLQRYFFLLMFWNCMYLHDDGLTIAHI